MKFPVNFPVSREFGSGDGFDYDCVRHHFSSIFLRSHDAHATGHFVSVMLAITEQAMGLVELPMIALIGLLVGTVTIAAAVVWLARSVSIA